MDLTVITPPSDRAVELETAKRHLRVDHDHDDAYIEDLIDSAVAYCETLSQTAFMRQTLRLTLGCFPASEMIKLPKGPVHAIAEVEYDTADEVGIVMDADDYRLAKTTPALVLRTSGASWPSATKGPGSVRVTYEVGLDDAASLPPQCRQAVLLVVGHWYANREAVAQGNVGREVEMGVRALMQQVWPGYIW